MRLFKVPYPARALTALGLWLAAVSGFGCYTAEGQSALLAEASQRASARDFTGAKKLLTRLLNDHPAVAEAHNLLGVCQVELGALDSATASFRRAIELKPAYASPRLNLASVLLTRGKQSEAAETLRQALALDPKILTNDPRAFTMQYMLALDYAQQGQTKQAEEQLRAAIKLKPGFTEARIALAKLLLARKNEDAALEQFEVVVAQDPKHVFALGNAGLIFARRMNYAKAIERLSRAHALDPASTPLALALAEAQIREGRQADADGVIAELEHAGKLTSDARRILASVELQTAMQRAKDDFLHGRYQAVTTKLEAVKNLGQHDFAFHQLLGNAYYELENPQKASLEFQEALRLDPKNEQTYFNLGMLYLKFHTPELANLVFEHGLKELPNSPLLWMGMGLTHHLAERTEQAATALQKAVELDPAFTDAYIVLGDVLESDNHLEAALPVFQTAIQKQPNLYIGYFYYGKILLKMNDGRLEQAIEALHKSTQLRPEFAEGHYELGRALEHAGRNADAIAEYKVSAERDPALAASQYRLALIYRKLGATALADVAMAAYKKAQAAQESDSLVKKLEYRIGNK